MADAPCCCYILLASLKTCSPTQYPKSNVQSPSGAVISQALLLLLRSFMIPSSLARQGHVFAFCLSAPEGGTLARICLRSGRELKATYRQCPRTFEQSSM